MKEIPLASIWNNKIKWKNINNIFLTIAGN